jgi:hypothetical protein
VYEPIVARLAPLPRWCRRAQRCVSGGSAKERLHTRCSLGKNRQAAAPSRRRPHQSRAGRRTFCTAACTDASNRPQPTSRKGMRMHACMRAWRAGHSSSPVKVDTLGACARGRGSDLAENRESEHYATSRVPRCHNAAVPTYEGWVRKVLHQSCPVRCRSLPSCRHHGCPARFVRPPVPGQARQGHMRCCEANVVRIHFL